MSGAALPRRLLEVVLALVALGRVSLAAELPAYQQIRGDGVQVDFQPPDRRLAETALDVLVETIQVYRAGHVADLPAEVRLFICSSLEEFDRLAPGEGHLPRWAAAVAFPRGDLILLKRPGLPGASGDVRRTLIHEYSHLLFLRRLKQGMGHAPRWLDEGVAMLRAGHLGWDDHLRLAQAVLLGRWIPLAELEDGFPARESEAELAYLESVSAVRHFLAEYGQDALELLLRRLAEGDPLDAALQRSIGRNLVGFEAEWLDRYRARELILPMLVGGLGFWALLSVLLVVAYARKTRRMRRKLEQWEQEEAAEASADPVMAETEGARPGPFV